MHGLPTVSAHGRTSYRGQLITRGPRHTLVLYVPCIGTKYLMTVASVLPVLLPAPSITRGSFYCLLRRAFSRISCPWNHTSRGLFGLASFTQ